MQEYITRDGFRGRDATRGPRRGRLAAPVIFASAKVSAVVGAVQDEQAINIGAPATNPPFLRVGQLTVSGHWDLVVAAGRCAWISVAAFRSLRDTPAARLCC